MTEFGRRFSIALGLLGFGVAGLVSMLAGAMATTATARAMAAGVVMWLFGKLLAVALFYDPSTLPDAVVEAAKSEEKEKKVEGQ